MMVDPWCVGLLVMHKLVCAHVTILKSGLFHGNSSWNESFYLFCLFYFKFFLLINISVRSKNLLGVCPHVIIIKSNLFYSSD